MEVTFRKTEVPIETMHDGTDHREMDIVEISYPDGKVVAFPADAKSPETGQRYRDMYPGQYQAFKNGEPDPNRVAQLEQEIAERQAELNGMRGAKAIDDERVTSNLGYGDPNAHGEIAPSPVAHVPVDPGEPAPIGIAPINQNPPEPTVAEPQPAEINHAGDSLKAKEPA